VTVAAVVVAGGTGERFGDPDGKQLARAAGLPILTWALRAFDACDAVDAVVLVTHPDRVARYAEEAVARPGIRKVIATVGGGERRQDSVLAGLAAVPAGTTLVAVHDGARPLVTPEVISGALAILEADPSLDGVVVGHPVYDTVKDAADDALIRATVDRAGLWVAQTPQVFRLHALLDAYGAAAIDHFSATDDASLIERLGGKVAMAPGPRHNIKVTVPEDLELVEAILAERGAGAGE
jgi:2-C-methyl-D-erythritol 4-phosphate cytidylyltransferase